MAKTDETIWFQGDIVNLHRCDNCGELIDGQGQLYWEHQDFTLCLPCLISVSKDYFPSRDSGVSVDGYRKVKIPNNLRWEIWQRDNFTCQYCGAKSDLTLDHIHPESKGGTIDKNNLTTACRRCNSKKGARPLKDKG